MFCRIFILFTLYFSATVHAEETHEPSEFTERILLFRTKEGDLLFDGLYAHEIDRTLFVSTIDLLETMGFTTELSLDSQIFKASVLSPETDLILKWPECSLSINKNKKSVSCEQIKIYEDELFISLDLASKILKSKFEYLPYKSEIRISTEEPFPILNKIRRKRNKVRPGLKGDFDPGFKRKKTTPQTFQNFYLDQEFTWNFENRKDNSFQYYSNLTSDVFQHEVQITSQGSDLSNDFTTWLVKRDFYGLEENKYVSTYQLGDVVIPTAEFVGGPGSGRGVYVTNRKQFLLNYAEREFEGNLRPDWEVELYVNDSLFARQTANDKGRYRFQNVPVQYGENLFRLEFYGPLGERKTEFVNNSVSSENLKKGQFRYEAGTSEDRADKIESLVQTSYGITDSLSAYVGYTKYNLFDQGDLRDYAITGLNGFFKNTNYGLFYGQDFFNKGNFYALRSQFVLKNTRMQLTYLDSDDFKTNFIGSKNKFLDKRYKVNLSTNLFGRASALYRVKHDVFADETEVTDAIQNIVLPVRKFTLLFQNDLVKGLGNKFDIVYTYLKNQFRPSLVYDWGEMKSFTFEYRNRFKRESSLSLSLSRNYDVNSNFVKTGYQQRFKNFFVGVEAGTDTKDNHYAIAKLRGSLGYTSDQNRLHLSSDQLASRGNICGDVFYDFNENGELDELLDKPIPNVSLRWVQGNQDFSTNENGEFFISNLPLYTPLDVQLVLKTLQDPQLSPVEEGYRVHLQKGQCTKLNFLVRRIYDFEGQIFASKEIMAKRVIVELTDAYGKVLKEVRTDKEGYFLFERLPARAYYMKVKDEGLKVTPDTFIINPYDIDSLEQDFYFDVSK